MSLILWKQSSQEALISDLRSDDFSFPSIPKITSLIPTKTLCLTSYAHRAPQVCSSSSICCFVSAQLPFSCLYSHFHFFLSPLLPSSPLPSSLMMRLAFKASHCCITDLFVSLSCRKRRSASTRRGRGESLWLHSEEACFNIHRQELQIFKIHTFKHIQNPWRCTHQHVQQSRKELMHATLRCIQSGWHTHTYTHTGVCVCVCAGRGPSHENSELSRYHFLHAGVF